MEQKSSKNRTREAYLLAVRSKELQAARERLAAMEELTGLQSALLAVALYAAGGKLQLETREGALLLPKERVARALEELSCVAVDAGEAYLVTVCKKEKGEGQA